MTTNAQAALQAAATWFAGEDVPTKAMTDQAYKLKAWLDNQDAADADEKLGNEYEARQDDGWTVQVDGDNSGNEFWKALHKATGHVVGPTHIEASLKKLMRSYEAFLAEPETDDQRRARHHKEIHDGVRATFPAIPEVPVVRGYPGLAGAPAPYADPYQRARSLREQREQREADDA